MSVQNSINTNVGALVALRNLNSVASDLNSTQNRISTGLRVSSAQEDASVFSVAQGIRANIRGFEAVGSALAGSRGLVTVGISATTSVSNLLSDVRERLTQLADESISTEQREIYTDDLRAQVDQLRSFIENAEYNGRNILAGDQGTFGDAFTGFSSAESVNAIRNIEGESLEIRANDLVLGTGGSSGVTGFVGLARIVYSTDTTDGGSDGLTTNDTTATTALAVDGDNEFVARSIVNARVAQAALAGLNDDGTRAADAFRSADTESSGTQSVFNSAFSFFEQEISNALGQLGADNRSIELQLEFNTALNDATTEGLGNLVDADLARESARLQALQTRQQLSIQALSIANQQPTNVLALFN